MYFNVDCMYSAGNSLSFQSHSTLKQVLSSNTGISKSEMSF